MTTWFKTTAPMLILFTIMMTGASASQSGEQRNLTGADMEYLLGAGDLIEVQVWKEEFLSRNLRVRLDGRISLPLIGDIVAAGKTTRALAVEIEERLRDSHAEPAVAVILSQSNQRYYVIGQVKQPGEFPLDAHLNVLQALARSGGFLEWAKASNIAVIRREGGMEKVLPFDYDAIIRKNDPKHLLLLAPGDTIIVP
jgi:polysaccharide biosynthesis/export protein